MLLRMFKKSHLRVTARLHDHHMSYTAGTMLSISSAALAFQAPVAPAHSVVTRSSGATMDIYTKAMDQYKQDQPFFAKYGFGPSVKAERWNGRHAMFGWVAIAATAYAKSHGLFPEGDVALTYKEWGGLAQMGFGQYISNERAVIMLAHVHALGVSAAAAFGPRVLGDSLCLLDGEKDEEPYGFFVKADSGLTRSAEMLNGRLAMVGLIAVVSASMATGKDILEICDAGVGGLWLTNPMF